VEELLVMQVELLVEVLDVSEEVSGSSGTTTLLGKITCELLLER
jgi:hypothetical protein